MKQFLINSLIVVGIVLAIPVAFLVFIKWLDLLAKLL